MAVALFPMFPVKLILLQGKPKKVCTPHGLLHWLLPLGLLLIVWPVSVSVCCIFFGQLFPRSWPKRDHSYSDRKTQS